MKWTYDNIMETAARCPSYRHFYRNYPLAYSAANYRGWLQAVLSHCGWDRVDGHKTHSVMPTLTAMEIIAENGYLFSDVFDDPLWPVDTGSPLNERVH